MRILAMMMLLCVAQSVRAEEGGASLNVAKLMQRFSQIQSAEGTFVEKKYLRILNTPLKSTGTLIYRAPGYLEKHILVPKNQNLILDGDTLTIDSLVNGKRVLSLQDYPLLGAFIESIRSTLAGDITTLNKIYSTTLEGDIKHWRLTLIPRDEKTLEVVRKIHISGHDVWVAEVEIFETKGDRSVMTVSQNGKVQ